MTPEQRTKYLKTIEKIELASRPEKWRMAKKFILELKPWLAQPEHDHAEACKELRLKNENKFAASKSATMRNTMKVYAPVFNTLVKLDPELATEWSGRNKNDTDKICKQLWEAFPEYRISRSY